MGGQQLEAQPSRYRVAPATYIQIAVEVKSLPDHIGNISLPRGNGQEVEEPW